MFGKPTNQVPGWANATLGNKMEGFEGGASLDRTVSALERGAGPSLYTESPRVSKGGAQTPSGPLTRRHTALKDELKGSDGGARRASNNDVIVITATQVEQEVAAVAAPKPAVKFDGVLPRAPNDAEKVSYLNTNRIYLFPFAIISFLGLCAGMWLFVKASITFVWFSVFVGMLTIYLGVSYFAVGIWGRDFDYEKHVEIVKKHKDYLPAVDIFLPCCGEPIEVLRNTWEHVIQLDWPSLSVHVLDDGAKDQVKALAEEFGFNYIRRPNRPELQKAGNLRYAFSQTNGEFFVVFDADFCPRPDFLRELMPRFADDPTIAIVQSPQYFKVRKEQTWVEKGAGIVQELFYRMVQVNRDRWDASICVGTCGIYRRVSLVPFGGTAAIGYSEDVHTGFAVATSGWRVRYIPICLSMGACPDNLPAFFIQQYRWCMGSVTLMLNPEFWKSSLTVMQKVCYVTGMMYYVSTAINIFAGPLPGMLLIWVKPEMVLWFNICFALPSIFLSFIALRMWSTQTHGFWVQKVKIVQFYAHLFAIKDKLLNSLVAWVPTGAISKVKRFRSAQRVMIVWVVVSTGLTIGGATWRIVQKFTWWHFVPTLALAALNFVMHLEFMFA